MGFNGADIFHALLLLLILAPGFLTFISDSAHAYSTPCFSEAIKVKESKQYLKTYVDYERNYDLINEERKTTDMPFVGYEVGNHLGEMKRLYIVLGGFNDDAICGGNDNDYIDGGSGNDLIIGRALGDVLVGFEGSDRISSNGDRNTDPDGYTEKVDCGPGEDEAWINISVDGDLALNCEMLHID